jgi:hypothetical protein
MMPQGINYSLELPQLKRKTVLWKDIFCNALDNCILLKATLKPKTTP